MRLRHPWRRWALLVVTALGWAAPAALAEEPQVPVGVQAELLVKIAAYDRNLGARAGDQVRTLVVSKPKDADSVKTASQFLAALKTQGPIGGLPHVEEAFAFATATELAEAVKARKVAIVYLSSGFADDELAAIGAAVADADLLTVSAVAAYVRKGVVLGFDLVSGKPKLVIDLPRANRQHVALSANVLRLMTVYP
ncbi:MAG: YfiR/HmsC family protein [Myxococcales bacterium]